MEKDYDLDEPVNWNHAIYMLGKLTDAIMILVTGEGDARSRLREAVPKLNSVHPGMCPSRSDIRKDIEWAYTTMKKFHNQEEYALRSKNSPETIYDSTLTRIKNRTASKIIGKLFGAWMELDSLINQHFEELHNK